MVHVAYQHDISKVNVEVKVWIDCLSAGGNKLLVLMIMHYATTFNTKIALRQSFCYIVVKILLKEQIFLVVKITC